MEARDILYAAGSDDQNSEWRRKHNKQAAWTERNWIGSGPSIGKMIGGWAYYAEAHQSRYESPIREDGVLGIYWEDIGKGLLGLLNGDIGGFDAGSLDHNIRAFAAQHGVTLE